ncbi:hypothetical protein N0V90_002975 [Kalmusia sp. IMI 367209]|nr:hypothetical protein N0V90_002975 [Kalmusia sp. IMI 367209]
MAFDTQPTDRLQEQLDLYRVTMDAAMAAQPQSSRPRRKFILCFDGTGNKFSGTDADSNILKIYRLLDRNEDDQFHYYQPGIGTYVVSSSKKDVSHSGRIEKLKSWYIKAKDSAVGTSFAEHVMGGYKRWQCRQERNEKEKQQKRYLLEFMCAFRETFSRPVKPIRFLGLFDTVNSVPTFENAWMQRSKFPYTARSTSKVIRHAVSIDERRAKFRQDLISQDRPNRSNLYKRRRRKHALTLHTLDVGGSEQQRGRAPSMQDDRRDTLAVPGRYREPSQTNGTQNASSAYTVSDRTGANSAATSVSNLSLDAIHNHHYSDSEDDGEQDIQEVWFAGCHADIGGGWPLHPGEDAALSHVSLVWMVREAQKAGLQFDEVKLRALDCGHPESIGVSPTKFQQESPAPVPTIEIDPASPSPVADRELSPLGRQVLDTSEATQNHHHHHLPSPPPAHRYRTKFHQHLHSAATRGRIHDVLQFRNGASRFGTMSWNVMEYLPFRRMDLQEDGSWKAITWPLPKGEVRDIPDNALIHGSVIKRMGADSTYRPGNLIVGGGGRGVRKAPPEMGMGKWVAMHEEGHAVGELLVRKEKPVRKKTENNARSLAVAPNGPQGKPDRESTPGSSQSGVDKDGKIVLFAGDEMEDY